MIKKINLTMVAMLLAVHVSAGIIEDSGNAKRFLHDEATSTQANGVLAGGFLARPDIWLKLRWSLFVKNHQPKALVTSKEFSEKYDVIKRPALNDEMLTISKRSRGNNRHIVFFRGGGYVFAKTGFLKWEKHAEDFIKYLGDRVTFVDYTGTQKSTYKEITATAKSAYLTLVNEYPNDEFILMGNSAGSNLALLLGQSLKKDGFFNLPSKYILISPWTDLSIDNLKKENREFYDFVLSVPAIKYAADLFRNELPYKDPRVSPLYGDFDGLGDIAIFSGSYDMLFYDSLRLYEKAKASGLRVHHYQYNKMWHDFMMRSGMPEAEKAWQQAGDFIK